MGLDDYEALHRYTLEHRGEFWERVVARLGILFEKNADMVLDLSDDPEHPRWFAGATLEITRSCFQAPGEISAIVYGREEDGAVERFSYQELEDRVNQFAHGLAERGLEPGDSVALYMPMTPECVVAYLGTVRSGCRVVSIADSFSSEELASRMDIAAALPWCTTPIEADSSLGPDSHHPIISLSGIPSAVMVLRILHPILASTLCAANPLARIAEPTIAL